MRTRQAWTSRRTILPDAEEARVVPRERVIELNHRRLPDPLPDSLWRRYVEQAEAWLAGDFATAVHCGPLTTPDPRDPSAHEARAAPDGDVDAG